jgi:hypothetical protein
MAISLYDELLGYDWVRYAKTASRVCCLACLLIGLLSFVLSFSWPYAFAAVLMSIILAIWEFPFVFVCIPQFEDFQSFVLQTLMLEREEAKAVLYFFFAVLCFLHKSINMLLGLLFLVTATVMVLAVMNKRADSFDGAAQSADADSLLAQYSFGATKTTSRNVHSGPSAPADSADSSSSTKRQFGTFDAKLLMAEV